MEKYDLIVIGSGPAGQRAAIQGAKLGKRVALVAKREVVGGACINTGTIPSKSMRAADAPSAHIRGIYGVSYRARKDHHRRSVFRATRIKTEIDVTVAQLSQWYRSGGAASSSIPPLEVTTSREQ
jgi:NAD(P) transhydrogenase